MLAVEVDSRVHAEPWLLFRSRLPAGVERAPQVSLGDIVTVAKRSGANVGDRGGRTGEFGSENRLRVGRRPSESRREIDPDDA